MKVLFITIGIILLVGMSYFLVAFQKPGIYPPKRVLKERAKKLGGAGACFLFLGILFAILAK
nr:hypothetical protein [Bacillus niameyensis]